MNFIEIIHPSFSLTSCIFALTFIIAGLAIVIIGGKLNQGSSPIELDGKIEEKEKPFYKSFFFKYPLWGLAQQAIMVVIFTALSKILSLNIAMVISALIFGLMHFPNFLLLFATFGLGFVSLIHYQEYHNLLFLGIIHGTIATSLKYFFPSKISTAFSIWKQYYNTQKKLIEG